MACCKVHKKTCSTSEGTGTVESQSATESVSQSQSQSQTLSQPSVPLCVSSSTRLQSFLKSNPYLYDQLPVLLARIDRQDPSAPITSTPASSLLAKDLEKRERIAEVLKEAIETDPKVAELYKILDEESLL